jgi:hypothetical protein
MHRIFSVACAVLLTGLFLASPLWAQSAPQQDSAELAFDIRLDQLRATPLYAMVKDTLDQARAEGGVPDEIDFDKINRVWGAVQFPETVAEMEAMDDMGPGDALPMGLFVHIEFADAESAEAAYGKMMEKSREITRDGKTYFGPKEDADAPSNLIGHRLNETTLEAGTEEFIVAGAGENLFSAGLGTAWQSFAGEPIRLAFDFDNARQLINEAVELAKADAPPMMHPLLDLANKTRNMRLALDFKDGGNLLALGALGTDEEAAEELRTGIDGMLGMAKMMGGGAVEEMRAQNEGMANVMAAILKSLTAQRDGEEVSVVIPKPEGFEDAIKSMMEMAGGGSDF